MALKYSASRYKQKAQIFSLPDCEGQKEDEVERPQQILANYGHISQKAFELLPLFFEAFRIS